MLLGPYTVIIILIVTMTLFIWGRWRFDIVALIALMVSVAVGAVPFDKVYSGLGNTAVITVACVMIISYAITHSGVLDSIVRLIRKVSENTVMHIASLTTITAMLSAFMNNVGALALMMPIAIKTSLDRKRSPSLVLMPIALGSALGGLTTVIGTPPNLIISAYRQKIIGVSFSMFDFSHAGLPIAIAGILFLIFIGWRLVPKRGKKSKKAEDIFQIQDYITEIKIPSNSPAIGLTAAELEQLVKGDFVIVGLVRKKQKRLILRANQGLEANDILIIEASHEDLQKLLAAGKFELVAEKSISPEALKGEGIGIVEAVVPQASNVEGRSSQSLRLRSRYNLNLLAIAREGKPFKQRLHHVALQAGDVVLLQGPSDSLLEDTTRIGLLPLTERAFKIGKPKNTFLPIGIFIVAILLTAFRVLPVQIAFGGAIVAMLVFNLIPLRQLYHSIDWPIIILLAAMIPIGNALQTTGGTQLISHYFLMLQGKVSPTLILALLLIVTMTLSDFMNNAATAIVMGPIAASIAHALHADVSAFLMAVAVGASCSFLTPVGHQNNTLVMGPGGYKFSDYIRVGLPLELVVLAVAIPAIKWAWPLH